MYFLFCRLIYDPQNLDHSKFLWTAWFWPTWGSKMSQPERLIFSGFHVQKSRFLHFFILSVWVMSLWNFQVYILIPFAKIRKKLFFQKKIHWQLSVVRIGFGGTLWVYLWHFGFPSPTIHIKAVALIVCLSISLRVSDGYYLYSQFRVNMCCNKLEELRNPYEDLWVVKSQIEEQSSGTDLAPNCKVAEPCRKYSGRVVAHLPKV